MSVINDQRTSPRQSIRGLSHWIGVILLLVSSYPLQAHDPPTEYYGRNITVEVKAGSVRVTYRLEISQVTLYNLPQQDKQIKLAGVKDKKTYAAACLERFKVLVPDRFLGFVNDQPLQWSVERTRTEDKGSIEYQLHLRANYVPQRGNNRLEISDTNFADRTMDTFKLKLDSGDGIAFTDLYEPREGPRKALDDKAQTAKAVFHIEPEFLARLNLEIGLRLWQALITGEGRIDIAPAPPVAPIDEVVMNPDLSIWARLEKGDLAGILASNYAFWLVLLIAFVHGAGHSLMPGHGKTMVAAYLVGERGTPWHAVLLGIVTTLTHTSAALAIAIVLHFTTVKAATIQTLLLFIGGLMLAGIGLWLFLQRLAGRSDHIHLFDMGHAHSHGEPVPTTSEKMGTVRLILLGIAGGIIPCWGAIVWVIGCIAASQFLLALPIVLAFSIGLSSVLIVIGLSVVYSGRIGSSRWGERAWFKTTIRWLPVFGATVVTAIGLFMAATSGIAGR